MTLDTVTKAPSDLLDYDFDFSRWMPSTDRIVAATAEIDGSTAIVSRVDTDDTKARIWVSGGSSGDNGAIIVTITTFEGRAKRVAATLRIKEII